MKYFRFKFAIAIADTSTTMVAGINTATAWY